MADPKIKYDIEAAVKGGADVNKLADEVDKLGSTLEGKLKDKALAAAAALRELTSKQTAIDNFVQLKRESEQAAKGLDQAQASAQKLGRELSATATPTRQQTGQMEKLGDAVKKAKEEVNTSNAALDKARGTLTQYGISTDQLGAKQREVRSALVTTRSTIEQLGPAWQKAAQVAQQAADGQTKAAKQFETAITGIFSGIGAKVAAAGTAIAGYFGVSSFAGAVSGAAQLEAKLSEVKAITGASADQMGLLRKAAEDAGASTRYTATEAADALANLGRAGLDATKSIEALPAVLQLAQAGGTSLGEAAEYVSKTVNGLGLSFKEAGRVADVLAAGANGSNTSVTGLAQAMSYAAPLAKSLGLGLESTVAIIGKFADAGIDASRAGTALNAIMAQFSDPASKFRTALNAAGITTGNFEQALRQLAASGLKGEQAILAVGTEAGPALRALLNQGIGALDELKNKLNDARGSAAATAAVMDDNLIGAARGLGSAWDTLKNALITPSLPLLKDGITQLAASVRGAVADGSIGKFGDALANGFQNALTTARSFVSEINFDALSEKAKGYATQIGTAFDSIGEQAKSASNVVQFAWGVMSAGGNAVIASVYGVAEAFTGVARDIFTLILKLNESLEKISIGNIKEDFRRDAAEMREVVGGLTGVTEAYAQRSQEAFARVVDSAGLARDAYGRLTEQGTEVQRSTEGTAVAAQQLAQGLTQAATAATTLGTTTQASAAQQKQAVQDTRAAVADLKVEYEAAIAAGNPQLAVEKLQAMQQALRGTAAAAADAKASAKDLQDAYIALGVTSQATLKGAADSAQVFYKRIRDSGTATANDISRAFVAYAEKAIEANNGILPSFLQTEAAIRNVSVTTDETGKTIVTAMRAGQTAVQELGSSIQGAERNMQSLGATAQSVAADIQRANEQYEKDYARTHTGAGKDDSTVGRGLAGAAVDNTGVFTVRDRLNKGTLTREDIPLIQNVIGAIDTNRRSQPIGLTSAAGLKDQAEWDAVGQRLRQTLDRFAVPPGTRQPVPTNYSSGATSTVNINLNGRPTAINTASDEDSRKLTNLLRQLEDAAKRAA